MASNERALELQELADREAPAVADAVSDAAAVSRNEREFQTKVGRLFEEFAGLAGVDLLFREEYTLATGRADAVYNRLIIEYEAPGSLRRDTSHGRTAHAIEQLYGYIDEVAKRERHDVDRLLGVAFDGSYAIFVRVREGRREVEQPYEWSPQIAARLLRALVALSSGRALIPENLVDDFGIQNILTQQVTRTLYTALEESDHPLVDALFAQWRTFFSEVSGYDEIALQLRDKKELRQFARAMGMRPDQLDPSRLFFTIHTYFSLLAKAIARLVVEPYSDLPLDLPSLAVIAGLEGDSLHRELTRLEEGEVFSALGLKNLLEGDFFSWYLSAWSPAVEEALHKMLTGLAEYNPATIEEDPYAARDLLKKLYHYLLPRELRHDLGEFYTPDWLASEVLSRLGDPLLAEPKPDGSVRLGARVLDPACGSGTFLILVIRAMKAHGRAAGVSDGQILDAILDNVVGIDLNPLAVLAARVGYVLAIADLLPSRQGDIVIPVFHADSILRPTIGAETLFERGERGLDTVVGRFPVPESVASGEAITALADTLYEYVHAGFDADAFLDRACKLLGVARDSADAATLGDLYHKTLELQVEGRDGIWARILKNAFMPLFLEPFDYVVGNPPWINWESLPDGYRTQTARLWRDYGLFVHSGMDAILGKGKKDISTLMTYVVIDRFLKSGGRLAFLITQAAFKTSGAAQGFRRFVLPDGTPLGVLHVDDLSELQPFEGASTKTSILVLEKGAPTNYPVPYIVWRKTACGRSLGFDSSLPEVEAMTSRLEYLAQPVSRADKTSSWLTTSPALVTAVQKVLGRSDYEAHLGVNSGGANAVYWLDVIADRANGALLVRNIVEGAKRKVDSVTVQVEQDLVFPLLRSRDIARWRSIPSAHILMVQDPYARQGYEEDHMQREHPKAFAYLKRFEEMLKTRSAYRRYFTKKVRDRRVETGPFYSMFDVGVYTFAPYKVVWARIGSDLRASVVPKEVIPQETITLVGVRDEGEAHYICGCVNSLPFRFAAVAYSQTGGKSFGSPHLLENLRIPKYESTSAECEEIAELARRAAQRPRDSDALAEALDSAAARLWGITSDELEAVRAAFTQRDVSNISETDAEP